MTLGRLDVLDLASASVLLALAALAAASWTLRVRHTRPTAAGALVGIGLGATWGVVVLLAVWVGQGGEGFESGYVLLVGGHLALVAAGAAAALALARAGALRPDHPPPRAGVRLAAVLGVAGAAALAWHGDALGDYPDAWTLLPSLWAWLLLATGPAGAALLPVSGLRRSVLAGWTAAAGTVTAGYALATTAMRAEGSDFPLTPVLVLAGTVVALAALTARFPEPVPPREEGADRPRPGPAA